ncbi:ATP-dependent protease, partial [Salmonella enterica subsp. enterica]|nr:ATP-dependent protease [Salmonella enterica subsp. enterica serovar Enteritidis]
CTPEQTLRYLNRLSGPFLDRFDLSLESPLPPPGILSKTVVQGENSTTVKQRVMAARERQFKRQNKLNAWLDNPEIRQFCKLESEDAQWLEETLIHLGLSIRAWQRLLKVARTIADIDQSD